MLRHALAQESAPGSRGLVSATTCFSGQLCIRLGPLICIGLVSAKTEQHDIALTNLSAAQFSFSFRSVSRARYSLARISYAELKHGITCIALTSYAPTNVHITN